MVSTDGRIRAPSAGMSQFHQTSYFRNMSNGDIELVLKPGGRKDMASWAMIVHSKNPKITCK
jgi:hypothetical protein